MFWIVSQFASVIQNAVLGILIIAVDSVSTFLEGFDLQLLRSALTFNGKDYYEALYVNAIMPIAIGFLILNVSWHLYKTMFTSDEQSAEDPTKVILRSGLAMVLIFYIDEIVSLLQSAFQVAFDLIEKSTKIKNIWKFAGIDINDLIPNPEDFKLDEGSQAIASLSIFAGLDLIFIIIMLIVDFLLLIEFLKVLSMFIQRYIYMGLSIFMLPLPMAALPCNSTKPITETYMKSLISSFISFLLSRIYLFFFILVLANAMIWDPRETIFTNIFKVLLAKGIGEFFLQFDAFLDKVGLTSANRYRPSNMLDMALGRWLGSGVSNMLGTTGAFGGGRGGGGGGFSLSPDGKGGFTATPLATTSSGSGMFGAVAKGVSMTHMPMNMAMNAMGNKAKDIASSFANKDIADVFKDASNGFDNNDMLNSMEAGDSLKNALNNEFAGAPLSDEQLSNLNDDISNSLNSNADFGYSASLGGDDGGYAGFNSTLQGMFENDDAVAGTVDGEAVTFTSNGEGGFDAHFANGETISGTELSGDATIGVESNNFPKDISIEGINSGKDGNEMYGTATLSGIGGNPYESRISIKECSAQDLYRNKDCYYKSYNTTSGMRYLEVTPGPQVEMSENGKITYVSREEFASHRNQENNNS